MMRVCPMYGNIGMGSCHMLQFDALFLYIMVLFQSAFFTACYVTRFFSSIPLTIKWIYAILLMFQCTVLGVKTVATPPLPLANMQGTFRSLFSSPVHSFISKRSALNYATASGNDSCDVCAHGVMLAPLSPHLRLDHTPILWSVLGLYHQQTYVHHLTLPLFSRE